MSDKSRYFAAVLSSAGAAAAIAMAPTAAANPGILPQPGSENASDTINDLVAQGYNVQVNWVNGYPRVTLSQCSVTGINTADATSGALRTVYIDIVCPK